MVRFSRVWRAVWRMGHPQVRWSVWLMTQHGGMPAQLQGDGEGVEALPLNWVECGDFVRQPYGTPPRGDDHRRPHVDPSGATGPVRQVLQGVGLHGIG